MNSRTDRETLVRDVASIFNTYIAQGVNVNSFVAKANPSLNIEDLAELLEIYFVLTDNRVRVKNLNEHSSSILPFIDALTERMRRLKTTIGREPVVTQESIEGPIDWSKTIASRTRQPNKSQRIFAYGETTKQLDLPENRVLKRLLTVVNRIVETQILSRADPKESYSWADPWTQDRNRQQVLREALDENPYLKRVSRVDSCLPYREIEQVTRARIPLYRDAANLLLQYRRLKDYEIYSDEAKQLLKQFFIAPGSESSTIGSDGTEVLFEFYWTFKLLSSIPSPRLSLLRQSTQTGIVAQWNTKTGNYTLYHDRTFPGEIQFQDSELNTQSPSASQANNDFFSQRRRLSRSLGKITPDLSPDYEINSIRRRPDIVVIRRDEETNNLTNAFIGEVKYTRSKKTIQDGVKQLLETTALAQTANGYLAGSGELLEDDQLAVGLFVDHSPFSLEMYPEELEVYEYGDTPTLSF